jgi:hypothetical protein
LELERKREDNRQTQNNKNYGEQLATQWRGRTTKLTITKGQDWHHQLDNMIPVTGNISIVTIMLAFTKI